MNSVSITNYLGLTLKKTSYKPYRQRLHFEENSLMRFKPVRSRSDIKPDNFKPDNIISLRANKKADEFCIGPKENIDYDYLTPDEIRSFRLNRESKFYTEARKRTKKVAKDYRVKIERAMMPDKGEQPILGLIENKHRAIFREMKKLCREYGLLS